MTPGLTALWSECGQLAEASAFRCRRSARTEALPRLELFDGRDPLTDLTEKVPIGSRYKRR